MIPSSFKEYFVDSEPSIQQEIIDMLLSLVAPSGTILGKSDTQPVNCPHCKDTSVVANGHLKGVQRYKCKSCRKNFSETTGKFWYGIKKKEKMRQYIFCLLSGYSIRKSGKECGLSIQTSFDWRHKLLTGLSVVSPESFEGIVESDDLFFLHSEKGNRNLDRLARQRGSKANKAGVSQQQVAVIATCDRSGNKDFKVATRGRVSKQDIEKTLKGKLENTKTLCTDSHRSYTAFAKTLKLEHKKFNASKGQRVVDKVYHIQNVNSMDQRLRSFMDGFHGVATKYLQNYLNWFLVLEKIKYSTQKMSAIIAFALSANTAYYDFKQQLFNMLRFLSLQE